MIFACLLPATDETQQMSWLEVKLHENDNMLSMDFMMYKQGCLLCNSLFLLYSCIFFTKTFHVGVEVNGPPMQLDTAKNAYIKRWCWSYVDGNGRKVSSWAKAN